MLETDNHPWKLNIFDFWKTTKSYVHDIKGNLFSTPSVSMRPFLVNQTQFGSKGASVMHALGPDSNSRPMTTEKTSPVVPKCKSTEHHEHHENHEHHFSKQNDVGEDFDEDDNSDVSSDAGSDISVTSTVAFDQESFESLKPKVIQLCHDLEYGEPTAVERMGGGSSHRVIGLKFASRRIQDYVLRIPRFAYDKREEYETRDQVAILFYASQLDYMPTASVLAYDSSTHNSIRMAWVLQERLPGISLEEVFYDAPLAEKLQITALVAELVAKIDSTPLPVPGRLVGGRALPETCVDTTTLPPATNQPCITGFRNSPVDDLPFSKSQKLSTLFVRLFRARNDRDGAWMSPGYKQLEVMANQMEKALLTRKIDKKTVLWLWDLAPQNILLVQKNDPNDNSKLKWEISGVLDLDDIKSVPQVIARKPLSWLWVHEDTRPPGWMGDLDEDPGRDLTDDEMLIKAHYDAALKKLCPNYLEDAYHRGIWIRKLASFAIVGFETAKDYSRLAKLCKEWRKFYSSLGLKDDDDEARVWDDFKNRNGGLKLDAYGTSDSEMELDDNEGDSIGVEDSHGAGDSSEPNLVID